MAVVLSGTLKRSQPAVLGPADSHQAGGSLFPVPQSPFMSHLPVPTPGFCSCSCPSPPTPPLLYPVHGAHHRQLVSCGTLDQVSWTRTLIPCVAEKPYVLPKISATFPGEAHFHNLGLRLPDITECSGSLISVALGPHSFISAPLATRHSTWPPSSIPV